MRPLISSIMCFGLIACAGEAPSGPGGPDGVDAPGVDPTPTVQKVSGKAMDYFAANTPMGSSTITTEGVAPQMTATSAADGAYSLDNVPIGSKIVFTVDHTAYRPTRNIPTSVDATPVVQDLYQVAKADVDRQYVQANRTATLGTSVLFVELKRNDGSPLVGIPNANVALLNAGGVAVPGVLGPYFFGTNGDIDPALTTATLVGGRSRVGILDVPPGTYTLKVTYLNGQGLPNDMISTVITSADGASLAETGGAGGGGGGGGGGMNPPTDPLFSTDIYPRLQKAGAGGLGCANCHTLGGPAGNVLKYDDPPAITLANMKALAGVIDLATPANSLLLTKPLYEPPPYNHPNVTFLDINDPDYKLFLLWITNGAKP